VLEVDGRARCEATVSFAEPPKAGAQWQDVAMPSVPAPESLPKDVDVAAANAWPDWNLDEEEFEWGWVDEPWRAWEGGVAAESRWSTWLRPRAPLPPDPRVHAAALALASDYLSHWSASRRLGRAFPPGSYVSLDHVVHVHRGPVWDDWWLFHDRSDVAHGGRPLVHRRVFTRDGALVASVVQEALIVEP
jgi:acyl-CoA thioesterase-2